MTGPTTLYLRDDSLPGTLAEFVRRFSNDESCAAVLRRWKYHEQAFVCPRCAHGEAWFLPSRRLDECKKCHKQVSLTAGTVMHGTRKPLRLWFLAMYLFVASKRESPRLNCNVSSVFASTELHGLGFTNFEMPSDDGSPRR